MKVIHILLLTLLFLSACSPNHPAQAMTTDVQDTVVVSTVPDTIPAVADKQPAAEATPTTLSGTLHPYLVANYGDKMQEVDRYRETGEDSMIAFILKTDKKIDMTQYLDKEGIEALKDYAGTTLQSKFMLVPD